MKMSIEKRTCNKKIEPLSREGREEFLFEENNLSGLGVLSEAGGLKKSEEHDA